MRSTAWQKFSRLRLYSGSGDMTISAWKKSLKKSPDIRKYPKKSPEFNQTCTLEKIIFSSFLCIFCLEGSFIVIWKGIMHIWDICDTSEYFSICLLCHLRHFIKRVQSQSSLLTRSPWSMDQQLKSVSPAFADESHKYVMSNHNLSLWK